MFVHFSCTSLSMPYFSNNTKKGIQKLIKMSPPKCWKKTQDLSPKIVLDRTQIITKKIEFQTWQGRTKNWTSNSLPKKSWFLNLCRQIWPIKKKYERQTLYQTRSKKNTNPWIVFNTSLKPKITLGQSKRKNNLKRHFFVHFFTDVLFL